MKIDVSLGEVVDKLSILYIKKQKITDPEKRYHVLKEWNGIVENVKIYIEKDWVTPVEYHMKQLIHINEKIWNEEDNLRNSPDDTLVQVCKTIQRENDARCRIKRKINVVTSDAMQEQKSYDTKELLIIPILEWGTK